MLNDVLAHDGGETRGYPRKLSREVYIEVAPRDINIEPSGNPALTAPQVQPVTWRRRLNSPYMPSTSAKPQDVEPHQIHGSAGQQSSAGAISRPLQPALRFSSDRSLVRLLSSRRVCSHVSTILRWDQFALRLREAQRGYSDDVVAVKTPETKQEIFSRRLICTRLVAASCPRVDRSDRKRV
jgi:hypothetical protein